MRKIKMFALCCMLVAGMGTMTACGDGTKESTTGNGQNNSVTNDVEKAGDDVLDAGKDVIDGVGDAGKDVIDGVGDAGKDVIDGVEDAGDSLTDDSNDNNADNGTTSTR